MNKNVFLVCVISFVLFSCGDDSEDLVPGDDEEMTDDGILLSFEKSPTANDGSDLFVILTDPEGNIIESRDLTNTTSYQFSNLSSIDKYNLTAVSLDTTRISLIVGSFPQVTETITLSIRSYFDISARRFSDTNFGVIYLPLSVPERTTTVLLDDSINRVLISNGYSNYTFGVSFDISYIENALVYAVIKEEGNSNYATYDNVSPNATLFISPDDFVPMDVQPITSPSDLMIFGVTQIGTRSEMTSRIGYFVDFQVTSSFEYDGQLFYPGNLFDFYSTVFNYQIGTEIGTSIFTGGIPSEITALDLTTDIVREFSDFRIESVGEFDQVISKWSASDAPNDIVWIMSGTDGTTYTYQTIISEIESRYPLYNLDALSFDESEFILNQNLSYDEIIRNTLDISLQDDSNNEIRKLRFR